MEQLNLWFCRMPNVKTNILLTLYFVKALIDKSLHKIVCNNNINNENKITPNIFKIKIISTMKIKQDNNVLKQRFFKH